MVQRLGVLLCFCVAILQGQTEPTGTLILNQADPHVGDTITFTATAENLPANSPFLYVYVECFKNGGEVFDYNAYVAYGDQTEAVPLTWANGGAATCEAVEYFAKFNNAGHYGYHHITSKQILTTIVFDVAP